MHDARGCPRACRANRQETGDGVPPDEARKHSVRVIDEASAGGIVADNACSVAAASVDDDEESRLFHFVFLSGGVRQAGG